MEDTHCEPAWAESENHEHDVTSLFLEQADGYFGDVGRHGVIVVPQPGGSRSEGKFLENCIDPIEGGAKNVSLRSVVLPIMTAPGRYTRLLQLADVVTGCTVARVAGESTFSPPIFEEIKKLFYAENGRSIGETGLKLHPTARYGNLYFHLLGDRYLVMWPDIHELPSPRLPYYPDAGEAAQQLQASMEF